jgi:hypothetical protein
VQIVACLVEAEAAGDALNIGLYLLERKDAVKSATWEAQVMAVRRNGLYAIHCWWPESLAEENVGVQRLMLLNKMLYCVFWEPPKCRED